MTGASDLIANRNQKRQAVIFSTDAGPVRVFIDQPLVGGNFGIEITTGVSPLILTREHLGDSIEGEIRAVGGPGVRLTYFGLTGD